MKRLVRTWFFYFFLLTSGILAGCANLQPAESVEKYIADRSREWTEAFVSGNTRVMEEIIAPDFRGTSTTGERYTKQGAIRDAKDGPNNFIYNRLSRVEVKVYGNTAVAFGADVMKLKSNPTVEETAVWTDTWLLRDGKWQVVASHESKLSSAGAK